MLLKKRRYRGPAALLKTFVNDSNVMFWSASELSRFTWGKWCFLTSNIQKKCYQVISGFNDTAITGNFICRDGFWREGWKNASSIERKTFSIRVSWPTGEIHNIKKRSGACKPNNLHLSHRSQLTVIVRSDFTIYREMSIVIILIGQRWSFRCLSSFPSYWMNIAENAFCWRWSRVT